jgi:RNA polymerase sigma-70 factor (ECF subfamily)
MTSRKPTGDLPDDGPGTLGDLLYADKTKARVAEHEWIELVQSIAKGDEGALRALYDRSHRMVFTLTMRITGHPETARELTVDVFHDVWRRAPSYDASSGTVIGWIMNQARSRAIDRVRFDTRKKRSPNLDDEAAVAHGRGPDELADAPSQRRILEEALATLTPDEKRALEATYFSDLTYAEAAARLHEPLGTIKTRIRSALLKLRQKLADQGRDR